MAKNARIRFELDRQAVRKLQTAADMERFVGKVAGEIADEMQRTAPAMVRDNGRFFAETEKGGDGWAGLAVVKSPFWHWATYGTAGRHFRSPQPFIHPSAQKVLSKYRGRWKGQ